MFINIDKKTFLLIIRLCIPVAMSYIPVAVFLGIYMVTSGIDWYWAPLSSILIFSGTVQFLSVEFIVEELAILSIIGITFVVSFRHIFYALSFPYKSINNNIARFYGIYALTDEIYAITSSGPGSKLKNNEVYVGYNHCVCYSFVVLAQST